MICEQIIFQSDNLMLKGTLHLPQAERPALVIGCHGLFSNSDSPKQIELAKACNTLGMAYFRFDHRGCGRSEGRFYEVTSFEGRRNDLRSAIAYMRTRSDLGEKRGLFGSSMGGAICLAIAAEYTTSTLVIVAAPIRSEFDINSENTTSQLNPDKLKFDLHENVSKISHIYIFHGDTDEVVPPSHAVEIYNRVGEPKKITIQKKGDHRMSLRTHQVSFISAAAKWLYQDIY